MEGRSTTTCQTLFIITARNRNNISSHFSVAVRHWYQFFFFFSFSIFNQARISFRTDIWRKTNNETPKPYTANKQINAHMLRHSLDMRSAFHRLIFSSDIAIEQKHIKQNSSGKSAETLVSTPNKKKRILSTSLFLFCVDVDFYCKSSCDAVFVLTITLHMRRIQNELILLKYSHLHA